MRYGAHLFPLRGVYGDIPLYQWMMLFDNFMHSQRGTISNEPRNYTGNSNERGLPTGWTTIIEAITLRNNHLPT